MGRPALLVLTLLFCLQTSFAQVRNYNEASKNELLKVLENRRTDDEIKVLSEIKTRELFDQRILDLQRLQSNKDLSERQKSKINAQLDTLRKIVATKDTTHPEYLAAIAVQRRAIEQLKVDNQMILVAGMLDDNRFIPVLKKAIGDSIHFDQLSVKLALARLKEEPFHSSMLNYYRVDPNKIASLRSNHYSLHEYFRTISIGLVYIRSQESILELAKFLPVELKVTDPVAINSDDVGYSPVSRQAFEAITWNLNNQEVKDYIKANLNELNINAIQGQVSQESPISKKHTIWLENWLQKNFGKYELIRD